MAWEDSIDRLVLQQIHLAEKGEVRGPQIQKLVVDLCARSPERPQNAFHLGYAKVLLGLDQAVPAPGSSASRWYLFGLLRGHDRRGERNWVAELIQDPAMLMDLLSEPTIAAACLPVVMRSLFGCGDLGLAMNAIEYLATTSEGGDTELLVDASLNDLLSRLETLVRELRDDSCGPILRRCMGLDAFANLPTDIRARYHRALGEFLLHCGEFDEASTEFEQAYEIAESQLRLRSSIAALAGLAALRMHDIDEFKVCESRPNRQAGQTWFDRACQDQEHAIPEAHYGAGILLYETADVDAAATAFGHALQSSRRSSGRDAPLLDRCRFYLAAALFAQAQPEETNRALGLMDQALETVAPDLETFYAVHEELKKADQRVALRFLDAVDVARGTSADQLLILALEYQGLGEAEPASNAARRVLKVAVDLDQRVEAMKVLLTCSNMRGDREAARMVFEDIRDLLLQRGAATELESLLRDEDFVGQALDHLEIKCELVALYEEMEDREADKAALQSAIARSLRARKDEASMQEAFGILKEVEIRFPELARDELEALRKLLALHDAEPLDLNGGTGLIQQLQTSLGHQPRILVIGGNERQRRHHPRFHELAKSWGFDGEWLMANYTSPQKLVGSIAERLKTGVDLLILLHWNRHETTEPALELARKNDIPARTVHYAGFTSLQVSLSEMLGKMVSSAARLEPVASGKGKRR